MAVCCAKEMILLENEALKREDNGFEVSWISIEEKYQNVGRNSGVTGWATGGKESKPSMGSREQGAADSAAAI